MSDTISQWYRGVHYTSSTALKAAMAPPGWVWVGSHLERILDEAAAKKLLESVR